MQVSLSIEELYCKKSAFLVLIVHECPELGLLQSDRLDFAEQ